MNYQVLLQAEFRKRKIVNPRYSVRGFARFLTVDASSLSQVLRGKRPPGKAFLKTSGKRLGLNESEVLRFLDQSKNAKPPAIDLDEVRYEIMANWYHVALFELFALPGFVPEPENAAKLLKISVREARFAFGRLEAVGLIRTNDKGEFERPTSVFSTFGYPFSSPAHRQVQSEFFAFALGAIETFNYEEREHSGLTVAARASDLPEIRKKIRSFQIKLNDWIERRGSPDSVYQLAVSYFPLVDARAVRRIKGKRK
jgi:uncharacterized protein (TIGR02147 family)